MTEVGGIAVDRLRSLIERIERLEEEKAPQKRGFFYNLNTKPTIAPRQI